MKTTTQYLDAAKKKLGIESDYALAPHLQLTRQAISKLRNRPLVMSNTTAVLIAQILELDPMRVIADLELERGTNDALWKRIRDAAAIAGAVIAGALLYSLVMDAGGAFDIAAISDALRGNAEALAFVPLMPQIHIVALSALILIAAALALSRNVKPVRDRTAFSLA